MKKLSYLAAVALVALLTACTTSDVPQPEAQTHSLVTFNLGGEGFGNPTFTRAISLGESDMTDLWVFDFVSEECVQSLHLTPEDAAFSAPQLTMSMGEHEVCFVASRGTGPVLDETAQTITWDIPRDTYWASKVVTVGQSTGSISVTLDRVATKLRLVITDEVPTNAAVVAVRPSQWYYGLNYWTGDPVANDTKERTISVPASYIGTTGQLNCSFFGLSTKNEWTTDVTIEGRDADGGIMGHAVIASAPFKANRATEYTGRLFSGEGSMSISLNDAWEDSYTGTW